MEQVTASTGLARDAIGLREVLFQSITHMAPAAAVAFSIPFGAPFAGGALPLAVLLALIGCLFVALSIGQLAKHLPSAGSFYTYVTRGIHPAVGFLVAWGYAFVEPLVAPLLYIILGITVAGTLNAEFGWSTDLWWIWALIGASVVFVLGYLGIKVSARTGTILGIFEIGVFAALGIWLIAEAGGDNTVSVLGTEFANAEGFEGLKGVFAGSVYTILAFIGFEAAAPLAEEARDPRRTIKRAVVASALLIGLFYVLTTYGAAVFFGPESIAAEFQGFNDGNPWDGMARAVWGAGWVLVFLAIVNSAIANSNAGANAATRTWYAMGRIRLLPAFLSRVHPQWKSPHVAVLGQFAVGIGIPLWLGFQFDPATAFGLIATILVAVIVAIYIAVNVACISYYWRFQREEWSWLLHGLIPVLGIAAFIPAFFTGVGLPVLPGDFIGRLPHPLNKVGIVVGIVYAIGVLYLIYLYATNRQRVKDTGRIFIEEAPAAAMPGVPM
ncbi:MAG TPA: APC family permease [Actinomycetota bacterium]|nr:APC family permease [Actinomycetota bacterium]